MSSFTYEHMEEWRGAANKNKLTVWVYPEGYTGKPHLGSRVQWGGIEVYRLLKRMDERDERRDQIIFRMWPKVALEFFKGGALPVMELRYAECGRLDNPMVSKPVLTVFDIRPKNQWINRATSVSYAMNHEIMVYIQASCFISLEHSNMLFGGKV